MFQQFKEVQMIKNSMKLTFVAATLAGMSVGAHATTTDLGTVTTAPITFGGSVLGSGVTFSDIFTFNVRRRLRRASRL